MIQKVPYESLSADYTDGRLQAKVFMINYTFIYLYYRAINGFIDPYPEKTVLLLIYFAGNF